MYGILSDAAYFGRTVTSSRRKSSASPISSIVPMIIAPHIALHIYESERKLRDLAPELLKGLSEDTKVMVEKSRHSLKMLEDTKRGVEGQTKFFEEIARAHRTYFRGMVRFSLLQGAATDLGIYRYNGKIIGTTHSLTLDLGLDPRDIAREGLDQIILERSTQYGQYLGALGATMDETQTSFLDDLVPSAFIQKEEDWKSTRFYEERITDAFPMNQRPLITLLLAHINFSTLLFETDGIQTIPEYPVFKMQFIRTYGVMQSLKALAKTKGEENNTELVLLKSIIDDPRNAWIFTKEMRHLRNALTHYLPDKSLKFDDFNQDDFFPKLLQAFTNESTPHNLCTELGATSQRVSTILNQWTT